MKIDHIALWVNDLELIRHFYISYFRMKSGEKYENKKKNFSSYFLSFSDNGDQIEIMHNPVVGERIGDKGSEMGFTHLAFSVGGKDKVDELTNRLRNDGFTIKSEPRITGDGYYESVVLDPEGNYVEICG